MTKRDDGYDWRNDAPTATKQRTYPICDACGRIIWGPVKWLWTVFMGRRSEKPHHMNCGDK